MKPAKPAPVESRRAWTGGSDTRPLGAVSKRERATLRAMFREQCAAWSAYWGECVPLDVARIFYCRARGDAHATHRALARRGEWK